MIGNKYVRAQDAHCQDLLREAERDRLTYGRLLEAERRERRGRTFVGLRLEGGRIKAAIGTAIVAIITLITAFVLSGGAAQFASALP